MNERPDGGGAKMAVTLRRSAILVAILAMVSVAVVLINQTLQLAEFAGRLHPVAGDAVFWGLVFTYLICGGVPLYLFLRLPRPLEPPDSTEAPGFDAHLRRLGRRLATNRLVTTRPLATLAEIESALAGLDTRANEVIRDAGGRIFLTTAISQYGAVDAVMVLVLQAQLVWDVAHLYAQRPTLRDMVTLYVNVAGTAFVAGEIEESELSEYVQPVISSVLGSAASVVPGLQATTSVVVQSLVSGAANAFLTLRVGIMAQEYSRALIRPERGRLRRAATLKAAASLGAITAEGATAVSAAIARASRKTVTGAVSGLGRKVKEAGTIALRRVPFGRGGRTRDEQDR
jgi:hypothetical protein